MFRHHVHLLGLPTARAKGVDTLMLLIKAWITDPVWVFIKNLSINLYLTMFVYLNFLMRNLGFNVYNKRKSRKLKVVLIQTTIFILAISPLFMLYYLLCQTIL
jgi:hypothetical protein